MDRVTAKSYASRSSRSRTDKTDTTDKSDSSKDKEDKSYTLIQISYWDQSANESKSCLVKVTNRDTTKEAIRSALNKFKCGGLVDEFQLWVKSGRKDTYQLSAGDQPFNIKMNFVRDRLHRSADLQTMTKLAPDNSCLFILRKCYLAKSASTPLSDCSSKKSSVKKRRPINWPFKKTALKAYLSLDSGISSEPSTPTKAEKLFGQHLDLLCNNKQLPKPLMNMLKELWSKGPFTVGIFRKSANARVCKEFRAKLESDPNTDVSQVPVIVIASVFKEFLRSLPDCVLQSQFYSQWIDAINTSNNVERRKRIQNLLDALPGANQQLLRHFLCALWHIAHKSTFNKMCSQNLGVCVGQSLLSPHSLAGPSPVPPTSQRCEEMSKLVPKLVGYLIENCPELLGQSTLTLLGERPVAADKERQHSAEESDSLNSLPDNGVASNTSSGGDESIDSLERALMDEPSRVSPNSGPDCIFANKMSLSNLSRDSGLTLSDTQLYSPEEDEDRDSEHYDSRDYSPAHKSCPLVCPYLAKSVPHLDQTGLDSDINHTYSYGRSVGVSIDGSCHDVVMRKRRHQANGQTPDHHFPGYLRNCHYRDIHHNNNHNYKHNCRYQMLANQQSEHRQRTGQHLPAYYSKSYSHGINGEHREADEDNSHREYRYRRPPLAAILTGQGQGQTQGQGQSRHAHTYDRRSGQCLRRSNSADSFVYNYDRNDCQQLPPNSQYAGAVSAVCAVSAVDHKNQQNQTNGNRTTLGADAHHYEQLRGTTVDHNQRSGRHMKDRQMSLNDRVGSICSSSSETASHRSSNMSRRSSSSTRSSLPPTYQQTMNRKEMLCRAQSITALNVGCMSGVSGVSMKRKPSSASTTSTNSNQIYEESVRIYHSDLDNKHNVTHRAVPVRVNACATDSDNSDIDNVQLRRPANKCAHKQVVRAVSEGQPLLVNGSANGRVVRISAQNALSQYPVCHLTYPSHPSHAGHTTHTTLNTHPSSQQTVSVLQRSAKDFTPEEWKKDINSNVANSVATLRKLFNCSSLPNGVPSSVRGSVQSTPTHTSNSTHTSHPNHNTYNIYIGRQSVRPTSVLIETNNNSNNCVYSKQRPNSVHETIQKGVTVVQVNHNDLQVHKRADSVGNSSEDESYV